jgi:hypothetical protein
MLEMPSILREGQDEGIPLPDCGVFFVKKATTKEAMPFGSFASRLKTKRHAAGRLICKPRERRIGGTRISHRLFIT